MKTMKKKITTFLFLFSLAPALFSQSGPPWIKTNFGYSYIFRGIDFPGNQNSIGFAAGESLTYNGDGMVIKTTDGGANWTQMWAAAGCGIEGSCFVDVNTGFIAGWPKPAQGWSGFAKTTDGGVTWTSVPVSSVIFFFTDVVFRDASNGILIGQTVTAAGVWTTNNAGTTWTTGTGLAGVPQHACYVSGNTYFLVDNAGNIQKSTNGGLSWTTVFSLTGLILAGIDCYNEEIIMACGDNGVVIISNDAGITWDTQQIGTDIWHDFGWETGTNVFLCGTPELVMESTNGGATWQNSYPQTTYQAALYECTFTQDGHGFICGSQGTLLKRNPACGAGFSADPTIVCSGNTVAFTSQSWGNIASYNWQFEGGSPFVSTDPNPVVQYNTPGTYNVQLIVSNQWWADTLLQPDYITVDPTPVAPEITANGYLLSSNAVSGNQWYLNGSLIPGATGQTWEAIASGNYWDIVTVGNCSSDTSNNIYIVMTGMAVPGSPGLIISPAPNQGRFTVSLTGQAVSDCEIMVINSQGIAVYQEQYYAPGGASVLSIDLGNVPAGIYFLVISDDTRRITRRFVVM
jgi:photosystem II stability/assembly factor-like uncharacterized protein